MAELGFPERSSWRSGLRARDSSPDSVFFTLESNLSLFSSASASVDRCSFASDSHDHDSFASEISLQHLAVRDGDFGHNDSWSSGPGSNPNKKKHGRLGRRKREKAKVQDEDSDADVQEPVDLDSARSSFSLALKECQERRSRSEALLRKVSLLDLSSASGSSPRLQTEKSSLSTRSSDTATFLSPGTPNYRVAMQKGWSSERVPLQGNGTRKHVLPLGNGRALPSKWEDAERWILSPVSGEGIGRASIPQPQRRPKSKSGPLGHPGVAYYSLYSPTAPVFERENVANSMAASPISVDGLTVCSNGHGEDFSTRTEPCMARSATVHGCSKMHSPSSSVPLQEDDKFGGFKDVGTNVSPAVSRRDMATQMSPPGSSCSSPNMRPSLSASAPSILPVTELQSVAFSKVDIRDVQVDEHVTLTRWSKKHRALFSGRGTGYDEFWKSKDMNTQSSTWNISEAAKTVSKVKSEEAKITAWENLQKAKAEAAIQKLEMKLEKKRASSMDKIMNKFRLAQKKAEEMRSSVSPNQTDRIVRTSHKASSFFRTSPMRSFSGCFTCHAFKAMSHV